jgi:hypothetical protein
MSATTPALGHRPEFARTTDRRSANEGPAVDVLGVAFWQAVDISRIAIRPFCLSSDPLLMFSNTRTTILAWGPTGILAAIALIWFPLSPLRFGSENYAILLKEAIVLSAAYGAGTLVIYRLREDRSRIAKHIRHYSAGLKIFIGALAFLVPLTHFGSLCMYMGASLGQASVRPGACPDRPGHGI